MHNGRHLLVDCRNVAREVCLDDGRMLDAMARAAREAGAQVISQVRYRFGKDSPPGFATAVLLDESHCTAHSYADLGQIAIDIFTCGSTDPWDVLSRIRQEIDLGDVKTDLVMRFEVNPKGGVCGEATAASAANTNAEVNSSTP